MKIPATFSKLSLNVCLEKAFILFLSYFGCIWFQSFQKVVIRSWIFFFKPLISKLFQKLQKVALKNVNMKIGNVEFCSFFLLVVRVLACNILDEPF
jgi:hypothetical protein